MATAAVATVPIPALLPLAVTSHPMLRLHLLSAPDPPPSSIDATPSTVPPTSSTTASTTTTILNTRPALVRTASPHFTRLRQLVHSPPDKKPLSRSPSPKASPLVVDSKPSIPLALGPADPQTSSPFFTLLPPELRILIYTYVFDSTSSTPPTHSDKTDNDDIGPSVPTTTTTLSSFPFPRISTHAHFSVLSTCRKVYSEAHLLPLSTRTFTFPSPSAPSHSVSKQQPDPAIQTSTFLARLTSQQRQATRNLEIGVVRAEDVFGEKSWDRGWGRMLKLLSEDGRDAGDEVGQREPSTDIRITAKVAVPASTPTAATTPTAANPTTSAATAATIAIEGKPEDEGKHAENDLFNRVRLRLIDLVRDVNDSKGQRRRIVIKVIKQETPRDNSESRGARSSDEGEEEWGTDW